MKYTKKEHEEYLNEIGAPEEELYSNGGRVPDRAKYGTWMRKHDSIAFNTSYAYDSTHSFN